MPQSTLGYTDGAGRLLDSYQRSIASNTVEEQAIVVAPGYLPTYNVAITTEVALQVANQHLFELMGSAANRLDLMRVRVYQSTAATTSTLCLLSLLRLTTAGSGATAWTPNPTDPVDGATTATAMSGLTGAGNTKGTEGVALWSGSMLVLSAASSILPGAEPLILDLDFERLRIKNPAIAAGLANGVALKLITAVATAGKVLITVDFAERFWS